MLPQEPSNVPADLIEIIRGIVLMIDSNGRIARCNPYFENLTGYSSTEVIGKDWFETFIAKHERAEVQRLFKEVMETGLNDGYTNAILTKDGEQRVIEWHSKTIEGPDGRIESMLCTGFDVTNRIAVALELEKAKELAVSATKTKTRFLAAASHDLRQPLQSLGLYLSVLSRQPDQSKLDEIAYKMRQSLDTMGELIDALLNISKLDGGSVTGEKCDFHLQDFLGRIVTDNVQQANEKGLELQCTDDNYVVHSDPGLLERVIENYVTNAIRYTEEGGVKIDCERGEDCVRIVVRDTGIGIPEDQVEKVFDEYYQLDNQSRNRRNGLGLGLSIVKHIGRILDHPLDVSSVPGEGSKFTVEVPLGRQVERSNHEGPKTALRGERESIVLFVDDDPAVVDATTMFLRTTGLQLHSALSGEEALAHIEAGLRPDILISDYRLPGYNGVEVVRRVRKATVDDLPVVLITGDTSGSEINKAKLSNCTVLHKPVDTDQLISIIDQLTQ